MFVSISTKNTKTKQEHKAISQKKTFNIKYVGPTSQLEQNLLNAIELSTLHEPWRS